MVETIVVAVFLGSWLTGVILSYAIKKRLKAIYPEMHSYLYPKNVLENNIAQSLKFQRFALRPSQWSEIEDEKLLLWLKINRIACFVMISVLVVFLSIVLAGLVYYVITGNK